jgi:glycosyltransferase involved in cell wall biosynthesis
MKLSILIPTISCRTELLKSLLFEFQDQIQQNFLNSEINEIDVITYKDVEILFYMNDDLSIGKKRNELMKFAKGEYLCFFDDDDLPSKDYISTLLEAIKTNPDCVSLRGIMTTNGTNPEVFEHSIMYKAYKTNENAVYPDVKYERYPNHISCIKSSIAKQFKFPEINHGEDTDFATQIYKSGLLKTEYYTDKILYYYKFVTNK